MKNLTLSVALLLGATFSAVGQVHDNAIGLRGSRGSYGLGGEITYQKGIGANNRIELDFGLYGFTFYRNIVGTAIYQWVNEIDVTEGLNWYVGPAVQFGTYRYNNNLLFNNSSGISLGIGGQIGIEYDLNQHDLPFMISFDTRPIIRLLGYTNSDRFNFGGNFAFRYTF